MSRAGEDAILRPLPGLGGHHWGCHPTPTPGHKLRDAELPQRSRRAGVGSPFCLRLGSSHFHRVHLGGAPALDLTGAELRAEIHAAAGEDPCEVRTDMLRACWPFDAPHPHPTPPHRRPTYPRPPFPPRGGLQWTERTGGAEEVPLWHISSAGLSPPLLPGSRPRQRRGDSPALTAAKAKPPEGTSSPYPSSLRHSKLFLKSL